MGRAAWDKHFVGVASSDKPFGATGLFRQGRERGASFVSMPGSDIRFPFSALRSRVSEVRKMDIANPSLSSNWQLFAWQLCQVWAVLTRNAPYNPHCA
jgi:hypothetical protein